MSGAAGDPKQQSAGELKAARTANTVATIGGIHALAQSAKTDRLPGLKRGVERAEAAVGRRVPAGVKRVARKVPATGKVGAAVGAGWLGLHGFEVAGDVMSRRTINSALAAKQPDDGVAKSDAAKADRYRSAAGAERSRRKARNTAIGGLSAVATGRALGGAVVRSVGRTGSISGGQATALGAARGLRIGGGITAAAGGVEAYRAAKARDRHLGVAKSEAIPAEVTFGKSDVSLDGVGQALDGEDREARIAKAYRRFDPEADRQRRIGAAQGALAGTAIVTGDRAARHFTTDVTNKGSHTIGVALRRGASKKKAAAWAAGAATSAAGAVAAHRHGVSARNQPWT